MEKAQIFNFWIYFGCENLKRNKFHHKTQQKGVKRLQNHHNNNFVLRKQQIQEHNVHFFGKSTTTKDAQQKNKSYDTMMNIIYH